MWLSSGQGFVVSGPWDAARGILAAPCSRDVACGQLLFAFWGCRLLVPFVAVQTGQRRRVRLGDGKAEKDVGEQIKY